MKKSIYIVCAALCALFVLVTGCSTSYERPGTASDVVADSELRLDDFKVADDDVCEEELAPQTAESRTMSSWELFRHYITTNTAISEEYFDKHFHNMGSSTEDIRSDVFDAKTRSFPVLIEDAELLRYRIVLTDNVGREYVLDDYSEGIYVHEGKVVDLEHVAYRGPTRELDVKVDKYTAIQTAKSVVDCMDPEHFDVTEAREGLKLVYSKGSLAWSWASDGNSCLISAETPGEVEVMIL